MNDSDLAQGRSHHHLDRFMFSSEIHDGNNFSMNDDFEKNENNNNKNNVNSGRSPSAGKLQNQQFFRSQAEQGTEQTQDKLDDERYVDDDFEDDDDLDDNDDDDDDDGIVSDCDDDGESLNESDSPYSSFKKQMKSSRNQSMAAINKSNDASNFFAGNSFFASNQSNPLFEISNQQQVQNPSEELDFNDSVKSDHNSLLSSTGETFSFSNTSTHSNNEKHYFDCNEYHEKRKHSDTLKQHGKFQAFPLCNGCGETILDRSFFKVEDRPWHSCCLKCKVCAVPLSSSCFLRNDQVFCREDFMKMFGSKCSVCDETIPSTETVRRANDNVYHLNCFRCYICREKLHTGDQFYLVNGHKIMCTKDYEQQAVRDIDVDGNSKRPRTSISAKQLETLKSAYNQSSKPARHVREQLSKETGLDLRVVQVWFQNRRAKEKRLNKETEPGKFNHFHRTALSVGNFEQDLNHGPMTKRQSRSGNQGNRKRSATLSHFSRLGNTLPASKHEILNQSFPFGNINDPSYVLSPLNLGCPPPNPISLQGISGSSDFRGLFSQVSDESTNSSSSQPPVSLGGAGQISLSPTDSNASVIPASAVDMSCYNRSEPLLNRIDEVGILSSAPGLAKLETSFSLDETVKSPSLAYPPPRSCLNVFATTDCIRNRFATTFSQSKPALDFFSGTGSMMTTNLNEVCAQPRTWLNDPLTNA